MTVFLLIGVDVGTAWNIPPCYQAVECGGVVGFIPALKGEAFSLILRKNAHERARHVAVDRAKRPVI